MYLDWENMPARGISRVMRVLTGKQVTAKDIHNLQAMSNKNTKDLVGMMVSICERNDKNIFVFDTDRQEKIDFVYLQMSAMQEMMRANPEILFMDTTYGVNNLNMHLTTLMVEDADGHGQVVAFCVVKQETTDQVPPDIQGD